MPEYSLLLVAWSDLASTSKLLQDREKQARGYTRTREGVSPCVKLRRMFVAFLKCRAASDQSAKRSRFEHLQK